VQRDAFFVRVCLTCAPFTLAYKSWSMLPAQKKSFPSPLLPNLDALALTSSLASRAPRSSSSSSWSRVGIAHAPPPLLPPSGSDLVTSLLLLRAWLGEKMKLTVPKVSCPLAYFRPRRGASALPPLGPYGFVAERGKAVHRASKVNGRRRRREKVQGRARRERRLPTLCRRWPPPPLGPFFLLLLLLRVLGCRN